MSDPLLESFLPEARELLQDSARCLLHLEKDPGDRTAINKVFRAVHTLKGTSGFLDVGDFTRLVHAAEDVLDTVRANKIELDADVVDVLLSSLDQATEWINHLEQHGHLPENASVVAAGLVARLRQRASRTPEPAPRPSPASGAPFAWLRDLVGDQRTRVDALIAAGTPLSAVRYVPLENCFFEGVDPLKNARELAGDLALTVAPRRPWPAPADLDPYTCNLTFEFLTVTAEVQVQALLAPAASEVLVTRVTAADLATEPAEEALEPEAAATTAAPRTEEAPVEAASKTIKVDQGKLDQLMNLIGEFVVAKNALPFLARRAETEFACSAMARTIKDHYTVVDRLAQEMQNSIMQIRMLPVAEVFGKFPRLVRDISRKLGKKVELDMRGTETSADKKIIEALGDPLLHILRNALDHGVERPDSRRNVGKPEVATIVLEARQDSDSIVISVRDDGRGIDPARIRAAAVEKGVVDPETAARMSDEEVINLIFHPGFSTAREVSDLSGRGVGMDVVLTTIQRLGGRVSVRSRIGEGTEVNLMLPLSLAITRVMAVEVCGELYGVPMDSIVETVRIPVSSITRIKSAEAFVLRDKVIPLISLAERLDIHGRVRPAEQEAVLVCQINGQMFGLAIDGFREGLDVILRPLEGVLADMRGYCGTALLGDGRILLVLDLKELI